LTFGKEFANKFFMKKKYALIDTNDWERNSKGKLIKQGYQVLWTGSSKPSLRTICSIFSDLDFEGGAVRESLLLVGPKKRHTLFRDDCRVYKKR
jgi:hypothetical protein